MLLRKMEECAAKRSKAWKKLPKNVPSVLHDNVSFHSEESLVKWNYVYHQKVLPKNELSKAAQEYVEIMELLNDAQSMKTVIGSGPYYPKLVKKFMVNLLSGLVILIVPNSGKFVRGLCFDFSPGVINDYLGRGRIIDVDHLLYMKTIVHKLSGDDKKEWPNK